LDHQPSEISLAELCRAERAALAAFADATYADLYRWFHWLTADVDRASDLTQTSFAAFWNSLTKDQRSAQPAAGHEKVTARVWLFAVGRNVWRKDCRQRSAKREESPLLDGDFTATADRNGAVAHKKSSPSGQLIAVEESAAIRQAVANLPDEQQEAITLRYWQEMSYAEIANVLGTTENNARQRVHQARTKLKTQLSSLSSDIQTGRT
jgi:RNA polymerase sigma-70 factor (ECF subfamily)